MENSRNTSTSYKEMNYGAEEAIVMDAMATGSADRNTSISYEDIEVSANITVVYGF